MTLVRMLGLSALAVGLTAIASDPGSAQIPGVKVSPQIRPQPSPPMTGFTPPPAGTPGAPGTPGTPMPPAGTPGTGSTPGTGTGPGAGLPGANPGVAAPKHNRNGYPKEIGGKTVDDCVREMKSNPDPAVRESAVKTLPLYGPIGRDKGADNLVFALTKDADLNVKMTALSVAPTVLVYYADAPDQSVVDGLTAFMRYLDSESSHVRYEAVLACAAVGPYMKIQKPEVIGKLAFKARDTGSWQLRHAAVAALGVIGQGSPPAPGATKGIDPDKNAVITLLEVLQKDNCAQVRKAAIDALIAVGPVAAAQQAEWHRVLENALKPGAEKEKTNQLWIHTLIARNDPAGVKGNPAHLNAIADALKSDDAVMRLDACHALALLGDEAAAKLQGLIDLIQDQKQDPTVVAAAMMAAATMKSQAAITQPVLQNTMNMHPNADVRKVAGEAIKELAKK